MKKQLLLGVALLSAISAFPQNSRVKLQPSGVVKASDKIAQKFAMEPLLPSTAAKPNILPSYNVNPAPEPEQSISAVNSTTISWKLLCGSMNCYGQLVSNTRPLQYNPDVNAVSFIHRKSATYTATPVQPAAVLSGVVLAEISTNWGATWDSTCIWNDGTNAGRYPQGAIYSAAGNTNIANAYVVGSGPTVAGNAFTGDWYASKKLAAPGSTLYNTTADATPNAQQFFSFTGPPASYSVAGQHSWSRYGFSSTSDGKIRSLALIQNDGSTLGDPAKMRGVAVVKGAFNAGVFVWSTDSIIPPTALTPTYSAAPGVKVLSSDVQMAFNQAGTVGYAIMMGALATATNENRGSQPIVYKTTNSGLSWAPISGINFSAPTMSFILNHISSVSSNTNLTIPNFQNYDIAVDATNKLHIGALIIGHPINDLDSLGYVAQYTMSANMGDKYLWGHRAGERPYLYDFIGDGTAPWIVKTIDSLSSEDPGAATTASGYGPNPWDNTGTNSRKINIDPRLQMGRTPDGNYITFSYTESDTNFVPLTAKWNILPNIKARCIAVSGATYIVSPTKINVSRPAPTQGLVNPKVSEKAFLHYMSPTEGTQTVVVVSNTLTTVDFNTPFTVTNSNPLQQLTNETNWYAMARLSFNFGGISGVQQNAANSVNSSVLYPNPAYNNATLAIGLKDASSITINVYDVVGQLVKTTKADGQLGENNINIDLNNLTTGIYMVNVKVGNTTSTKKLIIQ